jgi:hypothetical protein
VVIILKRIEKLQDRSVDIITHNPNYGSFATGGAGYDFDGLTWRRSRTG